MEPPNVGDIVEVTWTGPYRPDALPDGASVRLVERLAPPEPPIGSVALDADGDAWQRNNSPHGQWDSYGWKGAHMAWGAVCTMFGPMRVVYVADRD